MTSSGAILVVEDDEAMGKGLYDALTGNGYDVRLCTSGAAARQQTGASVPDLILLDLGLPDIDGVQLCRQLRSIAAKTVIVALTARRDEVDIVLALEAGADDYLTKPFRLRELLARIRAHLRRHDGAPTSAEIRLGLLTLGTDTRRVFIAAVEVELRAREFDLLSALAENAGRVCTREQLMNDVWGSPWFSSTKTLDMHVSTLRHKLCQAGWPGGITTIRGVGYRLEKPANQ